MKIICTKEQKQFVIKALANSYHCFSPDKRRSCQEMDSCQECVEKAIEWQIEDGEQG